MNSKGFFRIAHLTDIHLNGEEISNAGLVNCLKHVHQLDPLPSFLINGGDSVRDALKDSEEVVSSQWTAFSQILKDNCNIPIVHVVGNHDVFSGTSVDQAKSQALKAYGLGKPFYSFIKNGWKFLFLDSTSPKENGEWYEAKISEEQFEWLSAQTESELPVCIVSHIPILSAAAFLDGDNAQNGEWKVPGAWMHLDSKKIVELFAKRPSVKLCLSGHLHLYEKVEYNGITYICNGAVSGNWWKGSYQQTKPGFGLVDLYADGTFKDNYLGYF